MTQELPIEGPTEVELNSLIEILKKNEVITRYQEVKENIKENRALEQLIEAIKSKQKEAAELADLNKQLKDSIAVQQYREALWDANELLENVIGIIQRGIDDAVEKDEV